MNKLMTVSLIFFVFFFTSVSLSLAESTDVASTVTSVTKVGVEAGGVSINSKGSKPAKYLANSYITPFGNAPYAQLYQFRGDTVNEMPHLYLDEVFSKATTKTMVTYMQVKQGQRHTFKEGWFSSKDEDIQVKWMPHLSWMGSYFDKEHPQDVKGLIVAKTYELNGKESYAALGQMSAESTSGYSSDDQCLYQILLDLYEKVELPELENTEVTLLVLFRVSGKGVVVENSNWGVTANKSQASPNSAWNVGMSFNKGQGRTFPESKAGVVVWLLIRDTSEFPGNQEFIRTTGAATLKLKTARMDPNAEERWKVMRERSGIERGNEEVLDEVQRGRMNGPYGP